MSQMRKLSHRKVRKHAQGHTGRKWQSQDLNQGTWLYKHGLFLSLMSWTPGANVPTAFKLLLLATWLTGKHSYSLNPHRHMTTVLPQSRLFAGLLLNICITQSSLKLWPWQLLAQRLPCPLPWSSSIFTPSALPRHGLRSALFPWGSCTCPTSGLLPPESPDLRYDPLQKHPNSTWPFIFLWKYRFHLIMFLLWSSSAVTAYRTKEKLLSSFTLTTLHKFPSLPCSLIFFHAAPDLLGRVCHAVKQVFRNLSYFP